MVFRECATPLYVHLMSRYTTACDKFGQAFPTLALQPTNEGLGARLCKLQDHLNYIVYVELSLHKICLYAKKKKLTRRLFTNQVHLLICWGTKECSLWDKLKFKTDSLVHVTTLPGILISLLAMPTNTDWAYYLQWISPTTHNSVWYPLVRRGVGSSPKWSCNSKRSF